MGYCDSTHLFFSFSYLLKHLGTLSREAHQDTKSLPKTCSRQLKFRLTLNPLQHNLIYTFIVMGQPIPSVVIAPPPGISYLFLRKLQKPHSGASKFLENLTTRLKIYVNNVPQYTIWKVSQILLLKTAENMKISNNKSPAPGRTIDDKCPTLGKPDLTNARKGRSRLGLTEPSGQ